MGKFSELDLKWYEEGDADVIRTYLGATEREEVL